MFIFVCLLVDLILGFVTGMTRTRIDYHPCIRSEPTNQVWSLLNRVGCFVTWVTWVSALRGPVGQIFTWVAWVKYFCVGPIFFPVDQNILHGSKIFASVSFFFFFLRWSTFIYQARLL